MADSAMITTDLGVSFDDVVGLEDVKQVLRESVIFPMLRPDLFSGMRGPPRGVLLFGPPGNGKTFIAKALAGECKCSFISVSASSLTSKFVGESEKQVASLFRTARSGAPSVLFIDEIDSLLMARGGSGEQESSRRLKTEFMVQMDGILSDVSETKTGGYVPCARCSLSRLKCVDVVCERGGHVLVVGATNTPWDLDEAILRRFPKRILVTLPSGGARGAIIRSALRKGDLTHTLTERDIGRIATLTDGYSASDITQLVKDAAMGPVRDMGSGIIDARELPPITADHFVASLEHIRPCIDATGLSKIDKWNDSFGTKMRAPSAAKKEKEASRRSSGSRAVVSSAKSSSGLSKGTEEKKKKKGRFSALFS